MICFLSRFDRNNKLDRLINKKHVFAIDSDIVSGMEVKFQYERVFRIRNMFKH